MGSIPAPFGIPETDQTDVRTVELWGARMTIIDPESPYVGQRIVQRAESREMVEWMIANLWASPKAEGAFADIETVHATVAVHPWETA